MNANPASQKHLQNVVHFLRTFQAWMNLDFGIEMCFFDGYDTYISSWMQFVFPLYIWLLILIIVLASRYSTRVSKLTTSNTVPVLATLLLLSYTKLLITCIEAISFTNLDMIDDDTKNFSTKYPVWILDGNISYLCAKHLPLFLMSVFTIVVYIVPFTCLLLFGSKLQAKSHLKFLNWVNKLKPFFDAFYGPYTRRYHYWTGILLLARVVIFLLFALFSQGDAYYELMTITVSISLLVVLWIVIGRTHSCQYTTRKALIT